MLKHLFALCHFFGAFQERESLNANIVDAINQASDYWGIRCLRYEIKDIHVPPRVKESMQMQVRFSGKGGLEQEGSLPFRAAWWFSIQRWQCWSLLWGGKPVGTLAANVQLLNK